MEFRPLVSVLCSCVYVLVTVESWLQATCSFIPDNSSSMARQPLVGRGLPTDETSRSHCDTHTHTHTHTPLSRTPLDE